MPRPRRSCLVQISILCVIQTPDVIADFCLQWRETQVRLTREDMIQLVRSILTAPSSNEADHMLQIETFVYNSQHHGKTDLLYYPQQYFSRRVDPSPEEIGDLAMRDE